MQLLSLPTRDGKRKRMRRNPDPSKKPTKESRKKHPGNKRSWTHNQDAQPSSVLIKDMRKEKKLRTKSSYSAILPGVAFHPSRQDNTSPRRRPPRQPLPPSQHQAKHPHNHAHTLFTPFSFLLLTPNLFLLRAACARGAQNQASESDLILFLPFSPTYPSAPPSSSPPNVPNPHRVPGAKPSLH